MNLDLLKWSTLITALAFSQVASCAEVERLIEDYFSMRWFETEIIIFERPDVDEMSTEERLVLTSERSYPGNMRSLEEDSSPYFELDPITQLCLKPTALTYRVTPSEAPPPPADPIALPVPLIFPKVQINDAFARFLSRISDLETGYLQSSYRYLPEDLHQLSRQARRLAQRQGVRILMHERWLQPVPPRDQPEPLLVQRGLRVGQLHLLEGTIAVTIERYLHLQTNLWYQVPGPGAEPVELTFPVGGAAPAGLPQSAFGQNGYMSLNQSRRLRSGELHYLDHPRLGVIVRIDPVTVPDDVLESFEALKELQE